ncbi:hypothetical protein [Nonomuraea sediminis]|uniref:hypothetical protein n=1 Tax=Nonomuraea sediminis TaxID=2835864 RepID=UPI001BDD470B|nr:hypothetical protein [Nonomuraea sediminis]
MNNDLKQLKIMLEAHDPARQVRADSAALSTTLQEIIDTPRSSPTATRRQRRRFRPRWLITVPAAAILAGAALAVTVVVRPADVGPLHVGPAEALAFTRNGDYIDVRIIDPDADPKRYRSEFAAQGLDVDLRLEPASPSLVGRMINASIEGETTVTSNGHLVSKIKEIDDESGCGNTWCKAGVSIPVDLKKHVNFTFGRAARPGERYELAGDPTARGEILEGIDLQNKTVAEVKRMVEERHATIQRYYGAEPEDSGSQSWDYESHVLRPETIPDTWYVHEAWGGHDKNTVELVVASWPTKVVRD